ncbi:hypothetical protein DL98DRAFT_136342 [Cadophora sp. DSE1049]|nr:hypothetical protein DL98DRAFT_136342 [Cadophora sp. DSE1049]
MSVTTSIDITAPPAVVREKFLDFPSIPKYTPNGFIRSIAPSTLRTTPKDLQPGDKLDCVLRYGKTSISTTVVVNNPELFSWSASFLGKVIGEHMFRFEELDGGGRTRFVHEERFVPALWLLMGENWLARAIGAREETFEGFKGFNQDFKVWIETT